MSVCLVIILFSSVCFDSFSRLKHFVCKGEALEKDSGHFFAALMFLSETREGCGRHRTTLHSMLPAHQRDPAPSAKAGSRQASSSARQEEEGTQELLVQNDSRLLSRSISVIWYTEISGTSYQASLLVLSEDLEWQHKPKHSR